MFCNGFITSWSGLLQALESRLAPSFYEDPKGALFKLSQRGTVNEYLTEFERLANRVIGLPPPFMLSCFISGLSPEIRREVLAIQPISLPQETTLAKLQEDKLKDRRQSSNCPNNFPRPPNHTNHPSSKSKPPFVQRTTEEIAFHKEKGLCYNCDEKWSATHRCKGRVLLFIADSPSFEIDDLSPKTSTTQEAEPNDVSEPITDNTYPHISLHALSGFPSSETFRLFGVINLACLTILIDSGSTHNFLQPRIAQFLHLPVQSTPPLHVLVGNGSVLDYNQLCPDTSLSL